MVKLYGAGGVAGLEGYQTGVFVDGGGAVLSIDSPALDTAGVALVDAFGERHEATVVGADRATGLVLIQSQSPDAPPGWVDFDAPEPEAPAASVVWVLSNAFQIAAGDEPVTVQQARIAGRAPMPAAGGPLGGAGRPAIGVPKPGVPILLLDAVTSNPGAGGGLVISATGEPLGVVGAECRAEATGVWINYATPTKAVAEAIDRLRQGSEAEAAAPPPRHGANPLRELGAVLIPKITERAPAYVESVVSPSPAWTAGLRADDLIIAVDGASVGTVNSARRSVAEGLARNGVVELLVLREGQVLSLTLTHETR